MRSIVLLEMRALEIGLCTTGISTLEIPRPSSGCGISSSRIARCGLISRGANRIGTLSVLFDTQRLRRLLLLVEIEPERNISRRRITSSCRRTSRISVVPTVHRWRGRCGRGRVIWRLSARRHERVGERGRVTVVPERRRFDFNRHCWAVFQRAALDFWPSVVRCFGRSTRSHSHVFCGASSALVLVFRLRLFDVGTVVVFSDAAAVIFVVFVRVRIVWVFLVLCRWLFVFDVLVASGLLFVDVFFGRVFLVVFVLVVCCCRAHVACCCARCRCCCCHRVNLSICQLY